MESQEHFAREKGQDDLLALQHALTGMQHIRAPWIRKPYEAFPLSSRKIILSDETAGAVSNLEISAVRADCRIGASSHCDSVAQILSRMEGVCAAIANGFTADYRACCYLDYYASKAKATAESATALTAKTAGIEGAVIQGSRCGRQIEAIVARLLDEQCDSAFLTPARILSLNDALCRAINPTWELGMRTWDYPQDAASPLPPYQPPAAATLGHFLQDIADFIAASPISATVKGALVFFQLDAVRMFPHHFDQLGRIIAFYLWKQSALVESVIPPISVMPAIHPQKHQEKLKPYLYEGKTTEMLLLDDWIYHVTRSTQTAVDLELAVLHEATALIEHWTAALAQIGAKTTPGMRLLLDAILSDPIFSITSLADQAQVSFSATSRMVDTLEHCGIVTRVSGGRRNKLYECLDGTGFFAKLIPDLA